jgi:hypothetical protein
MRRDGSVVGFGQGGDFIVSHQKSG